ncbi:octopamine receptor beta-2R [Eurytemora carolleeae]|uniref:octopamine receptor beta-2R n=1 Tax=Eurytemora carolleeae TaxID=1294199 RepID=UPI000C760D72|nr:octopamine receptor beta-2R [Eurytemora carolleeae]|eukprot:XP_023324217.1 octopamine receptor beta-2R-like [Eurytemora affinis]
MIPSAVDELIGRWPLGFFWCQVYNAVDVTFCTISILHLCAVSIDRFYAIVKEPLLYQTRMTVWRSGILILTSWFSGIFIGFIFIFCGVHYTDPNTGMSLSSPEECSFKVNKIYSVVSAGLSFWIPAGVMVYVYIRVYMEALKLELMNPTLYQTISLPSHELVEESQEEPGATTCSVILNTESSLLTLDEDVSSRPGVSHMILDRESSLLAQAQRRKRDRFKEAKAAISLSFIMGGFLVCWMPFFIWMPVVHILDIQTPHNLYLFVIWLGYSNSALNPLIYGLHHHDFKAVFKGYLLRLMRKSFCQLSRNNSRTAESGSD